MCCFVEQVAEQVERCRLAFGQGAPEAVDDHTMTGVITASKPSWIAPFSGLSTRQFGKLITALG